MSNLEYLRKVLKMTQKSNNVGQSHGDRIHGDNLIQNDYWEDTIEFGDSEEIHLNKLMIDEYGDQFEIDSLTDSEIREFDLDFIDSQSNTNINSNSIDYHKNAEKFYREVKDLDPHYGGDSSLVGTVNNGDRRMAIHRTSSASACNKIADNNLW